MKPKLLESDVIDVPHPDEQDSRVRRLEAELRTARLDTEKAIGELETALASLQALRQVLLPIHRALKAVFGEIEMVVGSGDNGEAHPQHASSVSDPRAAAVWNSWKGRLSAGCGKVIDALMVHQNLNTQQLAIATGLHRTTIPKIIYELNKAGLINKSGGRFSLKQI